MKLCKECDDEIPTSKRWGYATLCGECDTEETTAKTLGVLIADGKTDYHIQLIVNPSDKDAEFVRAAGRAWDPRSQLSAIRKVSK